MCKVFAFTLLNSVKQSRSVLRQQRAALCSSSDKVVASASGDQPQSAADVSQSDFSRLLNQYREAEAQVCIGNMANISWIIYGTLTLFGGSRKGIWTWTVKYPALVVSKDSPLKAFEDPV